MMKGWNAYLRRTLSFALAVCMVMSMTLPAIALEGEEEPGQQVVCDHSNTVVTTQVATCTEAGWTKTTCSLCPKVISEAAIEALGHDYQKWEITTEATCEGNGVETGTCTRCGATTTRETPALGHDWHWAADAESVTHSRTCSRCSATESANHSYSFTEDSTSDESGHQLKCADCGATTTEAHKPELITSPPTCKALGVEFESCSVCGEYLRHIGYLDSDPDAHVWSAEPVVRDATCVDNGQKAIECTACKMPKEDTVEVIPAKGHNWGDYEIMVYPTCTTVGTKTRTCATCGGTDDATLPVDLVNGHDYLETDRQDATCKAEGTITYTCQRTDCKNPTKEEKTEIDKTPAGHRYDSEVTVITPATCTQAGTGEHACKLCGTVTKVEIPATGHNWDMENGEVIAEATCAVEGVMRYPCKNIGCTVTHDETIAKTNNHVVGAGCADTDCVICGETVREAGIHSLSARKVVSNASDDDSYWIESLNITCAKCAFSETKTVYIGRGCGNSTFTQIEGTNTYVISYTATDKTTQAKDEFTANGLGADVHTFVEKSRVEATCRAAGKIVFGCSVPGCTDPAHTKEETITKLEHTPDAAKEENRSAATCTADGGYDTVVYCKVCEAELSGVHTILPALGHTNLDPVEENRKEATCEEDGTFDAVTYCSVCEAELSRVPTTIPKLGHKAKTGIQENFANATCTAVGGYDTVSYCEVCKKELERTHTVIPALGHAASELRNTRPASENAEGYTGDLVCPRCNETLTAGTTIPRLSTGEKVEIEPEVILEVLNEEIKLDTAAVEDLTVLAQENGNNALELLTTVNGTLNALEAELSSGRITPEEYARCVEVANVAVSVALTVGAKAGSAAQAAAEQSENLPADTGIDMGAIVGDFYQRQFDAILGKNQPAVHNTSAFDGDMSGIRLVFVADENLTATGIDLSVDPEVYRNALAFIDDSVNKMTDAAATLRSCSGQAMIASVKQYIEKVAVSSFRDFDKEAADEEFLQNAYDAILLNMQQQVSLSLTEAYEEASKSGKFTGTAKTELDKRYEEQMAAVADIETFEIMVLEVMRQKYVSVLNTQLEAGTITRESYDAAWANAVDVETFEPIYWAIFRAWALNEESEYPMTLQELTDATIADTTYATTHIELRDGLSSQEIKFLTAAVVLFLLLGAAYIVSNSMNKRKVVA